MQMFDWAADQAAAIEAFCCDIKVRVSKIPRRALQQVKTVTFCIAILYTAVALALHVHALSDSRTTTERESQARRRSVLSRSTTSRIKSPPASVHSQTIPQFGPL